MTDSVKELIQMFENMSGRYSGYEIFSDWVKASALSVCNTCHIIHDSVWKEREQAYQDICRKYKQEELVLFARMLALLIDGLTEDMTDVLGEVYMRAGLGSKIAGQFFTPFHLSELCARVGVDIQKIDPKSTEPITLSEPSCGGGGMIIATAKVLRDNGINFQRRLRVVAQDLDWKGVYMTYLQLSLLGIQAKVVQGDTLCNPYDPERTPRSHILETPAYMMGGLP